jgi:sugar phosphate isomerase/epimerase
VSGHFFFQPQLSGRGRKTSDADGARPVVVSVLPQIAVSQMTTYRSSFVEEVSAIAAAGLNGIGLWRTKLSAHDDETVAAVLAEFNVKPSSVSWTGGFTGSLGYSYEEALDDARDAIRQAALWGAENLVVVAGSRNGHTVRHCRRTVKDALAQIADDAAGRGVRLALLPLHPRFPAETTFLNGLDDALTLLDELKHPHVGLAFDAFYVCQSPGALARIPALASRTFVVQINDGPDDARRHLDRRWPGQGELPLAELVHRFIANGYQGMFDVQVWSEDVWRLPASMVTSAAREFAQSLARTLVRFP